MLWCEQTQAAAVIDPPEGRVGELSDRIKRDGLYLRYALYTRPVENQKKATARYDDLLGTLGLEEDTSDDPTSPPDETTPAHVVAVRPIPPPEDEEEGILCLVAGDTVLRVGRSVDETGRRRYTIGGVTFGATLSQLVNQVRVALGATHVELIPIEGEDAVAYSVQDRLFTGHGLWAGARSDRPGTPECLLEHGGPDALIYPGWASGGVSIALMRQERLACAAQVASTSAVGN